jgi:hypothetical protein
VREEEQTLDLEGEFKVWLAESEVSISGVSSVSWGWDLRFLRTKKPARVADKNMRMSLRGHIFNYVWYHCDCDYVVVDKWNLN